MKTVQIDLSADACAFIEFAVRGARAEALEQLEVCRKWETPAQQLEVGSETWYAGVRLATADKLIEVLDLAVCISVTLPAKA